MVYEKDIEDTKGVIEGQTGNKTNGQILFSKTPHRELKIKQGKRSYISK